MKLKLKSVRKHSRNEIADAVFCFAWYFHCSTKVIIVCNLMVSMNASAKSITIRCLLEINEEKWEKCVTSSWPFETWPKWWPFKLTLWCTREQATKRACKHAKQVRLCSDHWINHRHKANKNARKNVLAPKKKVTGKCSTAMFGFVRCRMKSNQSKLYQFFFLSSISSDVMNTSSQQQCTVMITC